MITLSFTYRSFQAMQSSAFANQQRILQSRFPPARTHDDDAQSSTGSVSSWINVDPTVDNQDPWAERVEEEDDGLELPPADLRFSRVPLDPIPEQPQVAPPPMPPSTAAPVTQAARNFVDQSTSLQPLGVFVVNKSWLRRKGRKALALFRWVLTMPATSPCQPISNRWALVRERGLLWCSTIVISAFSHHFKGGCLTRS